MYGDGFYLKRGINIMYVYLFVHVILKIYLMRAILVNIIN